jgi:hypothetical protein
MRMQIKDFWITGDAQRRQRCVVISAAVIALYGLLMGFSGQSRQVTARQSIVLGAAVLIFAPFITWGARRDALQAKNASASVRTITIILMAIGILLLGRGAFSIETRITNETLDTIVNGNFSKPQIEKTIRVLPTAARAGVVVPEKTLSTAYRRLATTNVGPSGASSEDAWKASLALVSYHSFFVKAQASSKPPRAINQFIFFLSLHRDTGVKEGQFVDPRVIHTYGDDVPIAIAARLEKIGSDPNAGRAFGPNIIVVNVGDVGLNLDDMWMKNAVIIGSKIFYKGGPLRLEQVYFVNCDFQMESVESARLLGQKLLSPAPISAELD